VRWDGLDASGARAQSGAYFVRIRSGGELLKARVVLLH
jgi:hypothetical protein